MLLPEPSTCLDIVSSDYTVMLKLSISSCARLVESPLRGFMAGEVVGSILALLRSQNQREEERGAGADNGAQERGEQHASKTVPRIVECFDDAIKLGAEVFHRGARHDDNLSTRAVKVAPK